MSQLRSPETNLRNLFNKFLAEPMGTTPAIIEKINSTQSIDVKPSLVKNTLQRNGEYKKEIYPIITNVPVLVLATSDWFQSMPFKVGDPCILFFSKHSLDDYLSTDGKSVVDTEDDRFYDISDAMALIGLPTPSNKIDQISETDFVMGKRDGSSLIKITSDNKVKIKATEVNLGDLNASKPVAIAEKVDARLTALENFQNVHVHSDPLSVATGPVVTTFVAGNSGATTGSTKVKVDS